MFKVNDQVSIGIFLNKKEVTLDNGNALKVCHIQASTKNSLPVLRLEMVDLLNTLASLGLTDNSQIQVSIKTTKVVDRQFRVFSWRRTPFGDGHVYVIDAYYDYPKYLTGTSNLTKTTDSSTMLKSIADQCGIPIKNPMATTSDTMLWHQGNKTNAAFARYVSNHGFEDDKSHMMLAVDSEGFMRYKNINLEEAPKYSLSFVSTNPGSVMVTDFRPTTSSGMRNHMAGFRHERVIQSISNPSKISELQFNPDSKKPLLNTEVRDRIERSKVSYSPINFGNTPDTHDKALYQNMRFNMLKSLGGEFVLASQTTLEPGDRFRFTTPPEQRMSAYDGDYTVADKVIFIAGADYLEKVVAYRNGLDK